MSEPRDNPLFPDQEYLVDPTIAWGCLIGHPYLKILAVKSIVDPALLNFLSKKVEAFLNNHNASVEYFLQMMEDWLMMPKNI